MRVGRMRSVNREYAARVFADYQAHVEKAKTLVRTQVLWSGERRESARL